MPFMKLASSEGFIFVVDVEIAKGSNVIKTMLETLGMDDLDEEIPLPNVNSIILDLIIEWLTHHKDDEPRKENENSKCSEITPWDLHFLKDNGVHLNEIMLAALYLDIEGLQDVTCKAVAHVLKGRADQFFELIQAPNKNEPVAESSEKSK